MSIKFKKQKSFVLTSIPFALSKILKISRLLFFFETISAEKNILKKFQIWYSNIKLFKYALYGINNRL